MRAWNWLVGVVSGWWRGLSIINKTRIGTGSICLAVGFVLGALLL